MRPQRAARSEPPYLPSLGRCAACRFRVHDKPIRLRASLLGPCGKDRYFWPCRACIPPDSPTNLKRHPRPHQLTNGNIQLSRSAPPVPSHRLRPVSWEATPPRLAAATFTQRFSRVVLTSLATTPATSLFYSTETRYSCTALLTRGWTSKVSAAPWLLALLADSFRWLPAVACGVAS